jgi:hypothetical protein
VQTTSITLGQKSQLRKFINEPQVSRHPALTHQSHFRKRTVLHTMATPSVSLSAPYTVFPLSLPLHQTKPKGQESYRSCYTAPVESRKRKRSSGNNEIAAAVDGEGVNIYDVIYTHPHLVSGGHIVDLRFSAASVDPNHLIVCLATIHKVFLCTDIHCIQGFKSRHLSANVCSAISSQEAACVLGRNQ